MLLNWEMESCYGCCCFVGGVYECRFVRKRASVQTNEAVVAAAAGFAFVQSIASHWNTNQDPFGFYRIFALSYLVDICPCKLMRV